MSTTRRKLKRPGRTADQVFRRLIEAILSGEYPSGSLVRESWLARQWRISRTPLREAVRRAAECGFIVLRPNQAPIIRPLSAEDIRALYELREVLEAQAFNLAWRFFTEEEIQSLTAVAAQAKPGNARDWPRRCLEFDLALHRLWAQRCGNAWLRTDLERHYQFLRIFQSWIGRDHKQLAKAYAEHLAILSAIQKRNRATALARLRDHIRESAKMIQQALPKAETVGSKSFIGSK
jgi:DNA-binding GntR family transcriptional regulator